jgi:hypothetical protein
MNGEDYRPNREPSKENPMRLKIAAYAMCAILSNADTLRDLTRSYGNKKPSERPEFEEMVANCALSFTDALIKREEET